MRKITVDREFFENMLFDYSKTGKGISFDVNG